MVKSLDQSQKKGGFVTKKEKQRSIERSGTRQQTNIGA